MTHKESIVVVETTYICHFQPEPEGGYTVTCPTLPPVVTYGETLEEARAMAADAIHLVLQSMVVDGSPMSARHGPNLTDVDKELSYVRK